MEWNKGLNRAHRNRVYVPFDPEYTIDRIFIMRIFGWSDGIMRKKMRLEGFPAPKHFAQKHVRWHPQHINDWLVEGGKI